MFFTFITKFQKRVRIINDVCKFFKCEIILSKVPSNNQYYIEMYDKLPILGFDNYMKNPALQNRKSLYALQLTLSDKKKNEYLINTLT